MAASKSNRRMGCRVTSAASSGVWTSSRKEYFSFKRAVFGQSASGLAHQPNGGTVDRATVAGIEETLAVGQACLVFLVIGDW